MPPRRKSVSKSPSRSASKSPRKSTPQKSSPRTSSPRTSARLSAQAPSKSPSLPPPNPVEVQRLIDEAIARAQRKRATTDAAAPAAAAPPAPAAGGCKVCSAVSSLFGSRASVYSPSTTAAVTDLTGAFLVACITIYFTAAGYLFYREMATS